ncbi:DsbA family oxidoreductase [Variovorax sp. PCZ-1]|uniref:DsbA family oxidoreductase n=1 Tax=Variovorax sp. PCZ-1 TaxID=2835533 RepID=UPI001BD079C9|nr:DsbA family oxidoreductase [Variovorax sp. PCZ-1]MBS7807301.1 DsbA family oxidoreductase [Variovorax sp. PCZ-1]
MSTSPIQLEIVSDIVCPWCYIGKRRMEAALALFAASHPDQPKPQVSWLPFQLNPDMPQAGMSRADYLQRKFGTSDGGGVYERVRGEGKKEGLDFNFSAIQRQPNTLRAHALLAAALQADETAALQAQLKEAFMKAYFCEGADLTQDATLLKIATEAGMPAEAANAVLTNTAAHEEAAAQDAELRRIGISGVPFFILNRKFGVSGAQPPEALLAAIEQALSTTTPN